MAEADPVTLPYATTTVAVIAPATGDDTVAPGAGATVASGVRAHFSSPTGTETGAERVDSRLLCDPIPDLHHRHVVFDEVTFDRWSVEWVDQRSGVGLDHTVAGVNRIRGAG